MHYRREGQGAPVVLSHALGCNLGMWDDVAAALAKQATVVRYDTRCHGASEVVTTAFSLADLVSDAVRLIDDLQCEAVSWVGLSMGGMIGQGLAIAHPEREKKLVLANTASRYPDEARSLWAARARIARAEGMPALADLIMIRYFSPAFRTDRPDDVARFRDQVLAVDAEGYAACCEAIRSLNYYSELDRISCPTLVIAGGADVAASPALAEEITSRVPRSHLAVIDGAGHLSAVEYPETFVRLVGDFL